LRCAMEEQDHPFSEMDTRNREFLALLGKHELQIASCVHALVPSWHDAEDILQETKLQLWREFAKFRSGSDFAAWSRTIARYVVQTHYKRRQRKPLLLSDDVVEAVLKKIAKTPEQSDRRLQMLAECVKKLGGDAFDLLRRCYLEERKIKDIAADLGRSLTGTYSALSRTRRELLECMRDSLRRENDP
jgi:RNA polymerase sigma-70 factor, ECF subfamily